MRNRNTLGDWRPPQRLINSVERKTLTNPQSYQQNQFKALTQQQMNDRISRTINEALMKLPNQGKRTSISTAVQPKVSNLLSNMCSFMALIDRNFQKANLQIETIPQLLTFWGYPHNYNKSVFQPVGAPHTWPVCMQMMQFLAQIGLFVFEYRSIGDEFKPDIQQIDYLLDAYARDDVSQIDGYLSKIRLNLTKQQQQLNYKIQSSQLTFKNIKNSQRSLNQMQSQQKVLLQKLQRQSQNVIELDQKNNSILNQIQIADDQIQQLSLIRDTLLKKITMLQQQITNQQINVQQATKIQHQIKQYHHRIKQSQNQLQLHKKQYQHQKTKLTQTFYKISDDLTEIKTSMKKYQQQIQKKNIDIPFPHLDHVSFTQAIHTQNLQIFNQSILKIIQTDKIKNMLLGQQSLADLLDHQARNLTLHIIDHQNKIKIVQQDNKQGSGQLNKLQKYFQETDKQLQSLISKKKINVDQTQVVKDRTHLIKLENEELIKKETQLSQQTKQRKQHMIEGIKMLNKYEADCERVIKAMDQKEQEVERKVQQIMGRIQNGFNFLNSQLQSLI